MSKQSTLQYLTVYYIIKSGVTELNYISIAADAFGKLCQASDPARILNLEAEKTEIYFHNPKQHVKILIHLAELNGFPFSLTLFHFNCHFLSLPLFKRQLLKG